MLVKTENKAPWKNFLWMTDAKTMIEKEDLEEPWRLGKDPTRKNINMTASMTASVGCPWQRQRKVLTTRVLPAGIGGDRVLGIAAKHALALESDLDQVYTSHMHAENPVSDAANTPFISSDSSKHGMIVDIKELLAPIVGGVLVEMIIGSHSDDFLREYMYFWTKNKGPRGEQTFSFLAGMPEGTNYTVRLGQLVNTAFAQRSPSRDPLPAGSCSLMQGLVHDMVDKEEEAVDENFLIREEAVGNMTSFLTAGFETTFSVVIWTLIALGAEKHSELRKRVKEECELLERDEELQKEHIELLKTLKKAGMMGDPLPACLYEDRKVIPKNDLLVRCIAETLTMFPPVWSLPRAQTQPNTRSDGGLGCLFSAFGLSEKTQRRKMDGRPLSMNGVQEDWPYAWDPLRLRPPHSSIHAFGVGERACPAGTAALLIAWTLLRTLLLRWEVEELVEGQAVASCYLHPVLLAAGPQQVRITSTARAAASRYGV